MESAAGAKCYKLLYAACALVATCQLTVMLYRYTFQARRISSNVFYPSEFKLPAISICAPTPLFDPDFYSLSFESRSQLNITFAEHYNNSLLPHLIASCVVMLPNLSTRNCSAVSRVKIYASKQHICYTYFDGEHLFEHRIYKLKVVDGFTVVELQISLHGTRNAQVVVALHAPDEPPMTDVTSSHCIDVNINTTQEIYLAVNVELIRNVNAPPHVCTNYQKRGYKNNAECDDVCLKSRAKAINGKWPAEVMGTIDSEGKERVLDGDHLDDKDMMTCFLHTCANDDCDTDSYYVTRRNTVTANRSAHNHFLTVSFGSPLVRKTIIVHSQALTVDEVISHVGGIFGIWIGLSLTAVLNRLWLALDRIMNVFDATPRTDENRLATPVLLFEREVRLQSTD